jgi:tetratricopeptide (TPR) repeat protein
MAKRYLEDDIRLHTDLDDPMVINFSKEINNMEYQEKFTLFLQTVNINAEDIYDKQTRKRLINMCEEYYDGNDKEINFIEEFSLSYQPEQAISWYMRESCLHRLLTRAFNEQDMNLLVDMYSFIVDINRDLQKKKIKQSSSLRVFRGQFISNERLAQLKNNVNQIITMQCFFSAQTSRDETLHLLQSIEPIDPTFRRILFEIDVSQDYTFADNNQSSTSKTVLFMLGAVFKIVDVTETTVILSQYNSHLTGNYDLTNESSVIIRGVLTYLKDGPREAIKYFEKILRNRSSIDPATYSSIYGQLGYLQQKLGDLIAATKMYEQAMNHGTMQFGLYLFYLDQAAQYHARVLGDWEKAKTIWIQKLNIQNAFLLEETKAQTYENLARAAFETKQHVKTIEYTLAAIQNLPNDHPHLPFLQQQLECARKDLSEETN